MIHYFAQVQNCPDGTPDTTSLTCIPQVAADKVTLTSVMSIVFGVLAAIAVLVIVIQGIRFVLSQGDPQKAGDARRGVIYAVVGLVVAVSADVFINVVLGRL